MRADITRITLTRYDKDGRLIERVVYDERGNIVERVKDASH